MEARRRLVRLPRGVLREAGLVREWKGMKATEILEGPRFPPSVRGVATLHLCSSSFSFSLIFLGKPKRQLLFSFS